MPEVRQSKWDKSVPAYIESMQRPSSESAKSQRFGILLNELFGEQPGFIEEYVSGIERYVNVKEKDRILRGRVDNLFGSLVIEFEQDLRATLADAEDQLRKYVSCIWSQEAPGARRPYLGIATDGIHFRIYSPYIGDPAAPQVEPEEVQLGQIEEVDLRELEAAEVYFWLDRYFRRQEILPPTTENIVADFGVKSHAFQVASASLLSLWRQLGQEPQFAVVYESWAKYLLIVYGSSVADDELFIRHTYLATLAKLMAWCRLTEATTADVDELASVLEGEFFKRQGIENFLEEDFFSWLVRDQAAGMGIETARMLFSLLQNYNLRELSEDVLKSLYQELVDPETRHDLGEYYTPDWLAHRIVRELLDENPEAKMLDPACGSGTFLYLAIREKRERLGDSLETLKHIQEAVVGIDIHPLAVIVAKTNYVLGLGDLVKKRTGLAGKVAIPIYLADAMRLPEWREKPSLWMQLPSYKVKLDGREIYLPERLVSDPATYDQTIEAAREFASENVGRDPTLEQFANYLQRRVPALAEEDALVEALFRTAETLREFIESNRDTIWAFILKNIYKPLFLRHGFDCVVGNPPWLAYRFAEPQYQQFLKEQITDRYALSSGSSQNVANLELGSLFLVRACDLYLREGGIIAFVLPRSLFSADQHDALRRGEFAGTGLTIKEVWDLEGVSPLFNVPSCVVFAAKAGGGTIYPINGQQWAGLLRRRNAAWSEAEGTLGVKSERYSLNEVGSRSFWAVGPPIRSQEPSPYRVSFRRGADLYPRALWFVSVNPSPLGFDPSLPPLESAKWTRKYAKRRWRGLVLGGSVETRFLYATVQSVHLLPFSHLQYSLVVVPIEPDDEGSRLIDADEARRRGLLHLAQWIEDAEGEWQRRRGAKADKMSLFERLDYHHDLTLQNPRARYRVVYPSSATYLCASVVERSRIPFQVHGQELVAAGFVADVNSYVFESDCRDEVFYLAAVLNSPSIDRLLKPMQSRGLFGPRHIHKKVLELPIPQFDGSNPAHLELAALGEQCTEEVQRWLDAGGPGEVRAIGRLRAMVREMLAEELKEIDELVEPMLRGD